MFAYFYGTVTFFKKLELRFGAQTKYVILVEFSESLLHFIHSSIIVSS